MAKKWWYDFPWREIQTNLRETDMADIKAGEFVRQLQSFDATVVMINTSGIIASYPTELDFHFQSEYLTGDSLEDIIRECHRAGIRVIARTDFSKVRLPVYEQHPEWAFRRRDGGIVNYNGDVHVCINSDYQQKYALEIMAETVRKLDIDGMFFNMGGFVQRDYSGNTYGLCHCARCRERFLDAYGFALPETDSLDDPACRAYKRFQKDVVEAQNAAVYALLTSLKPDICVSRCADEGMFRQEANTALDRALPKWQYTAAENTKYVKSSYDHRMVSTNTTVDFIDFPARHAAVSPSLQRIRLYQSLAQGGALDYYLIGRLDNHRDRSGYTGVREVFAFHKRNEDTYNKLDSAAKIALLKDPDGCQNEYRGWYRFLAENHYLFDTPLKGRLTPGRLARYEAVILPDCKYLSAALAGMLDGFVTAGGKLISGFGSATGDGQYAPLAKPALDCLGVDEVLITRDDMRGSYFELEAGAFPSLPETELIYLDESYIYASYASDVTFHGKLIPPQMFGPPERCYPTVFSGHPCFLTRAYGKGRAMLIPWKPGKFFYNQGYPSYLRFVNDLLETVMGIPRVQTDLPEMVEITSHTDADNRFELVSLVNGTGHFGLSFYEPVPLDGYSLTLPCKRVPQRVYSLVTGKNADFTTQDGSLSVKLPRIGMFEALRIE